jgi:hypothetical protein
MIQQLHRSELAVLSGIKSFPSLFHSTPSENGMSFKKRLMAALSSS